MSNNDHYHSKADGVFSASNGEYLCSHCVFLDPEPDAPDSDAWKRAEQLNFIANEPPLAICDLCKSGYFDWETDDGSWQLLPKRYRPMALCEDDFVRILTKSKIDTSSIPYTYYSFAYRVARNLESLHIPAHYTHIQFEDLHETMWCEVVKCKEDRTFVVRLSNDSNFDKKLTDNTYMLAKWNGSRRHAETGRPILTPISKTARPSEKKVRTGRSRPVGVKRNSTQLTRKRTSARERLTKSPTKREK